MSFLKELVGGGKKTVRALEGLYEASAKARLPYEADWWVNTAFLQGEQYVEWKDDIAAIRRIPRTTETQNAPRPVVNKIMAFVNQQHSFALQNDPIADVLPMSTDPSKIVSAEVGLAYCDYAMTPEVMNFEEKHSRAVMWALTAGSTWMKWGWDDKRKRPFCYAGTPFEYYADAFASSAEEVRYMVHAKRYDLEEVYNLWGVELKQKPEVYDETRAQLLRNMGHAPVVHGVTVKETWVRPSRRYPKGVYAVHCGDELLVEPRKLPYEHLIEQDTLPFTQIGTIIRPGALYYDSPVKFLISPQMELNKYHAQRIAIRDNFANPKWLIPEEIEVSEYPNQKPNQIIHYKATVDPGLKPEIVQAAAMADNQDGTWITEEMMNTVGLHEVSQGQVPGRVESAKAIETLREADNSRLATLLKTIKRSLGSGYWHVLMLAKQFEEEEKLIQIFDPSTPMTVRRFKRENIDPGTRFRVTMGTGLAYSRAGRAEQLLELWREGVLQQNPDRFLELLDVPARAALSATAADVREAREENFVLAEGQAIEPASWHDHAIHLREHNAFRKTVEYKLLSSEAKGRFEHHCQRHEALQVDQLAKQAQLQAMAQGQPIPPDTPEMDDGKRPAPPKTSGEDTPSDEKAGQTAPGDTPGGVGVV